MTPFTTPSSRRQRFRIAGLAAALFVAGSALWSGQASAQTPYYPGYGYAYPGYAPAPYYPAPYYGYPYPAYYSPYYYPYGWGGINVGFGRGFGFGHGFGRGFGHGFGGHGFGHGGHR